MRRKQIEVDANIYYTNELGDREFTIEPFTFDLDDLEYYFRDRSGGTVMALSGVEVELSLTYEFFSQSIQELRFCQEWGPYVKRLEDGNYVGIN